MSELGEEKKERKRKPSGGEISLSALTAAPGIYDRFSISHNQQISPPTSEASASPLTPQDQQPSNRVQQHLGPDYAPHIHRFPSLLFSAIIISNALFARMHTRPAAHHFHLHAGLLLRCLGLVEPEVPPVSSVARSCGPVGSREGKSSC